MDKKELEEIKKRVQHIEKEVKDTKDNDPKLGHVEKELDTIANTLLEAIKNLFKK